MALTPDQVREYDLPSEPFKLDTKTGLPKDHKRVMAWKAAHGVDQTEIDSLATLRPDVLEEIAREAIDPFYDHGPARRTAAARAEWEARAQQALTDALGANWLTQLTVDALDRVTGIEQDIEDLNDLLRVDTSDVELPAAPDLPEPEYFSLDLGGALPPTYCEQARIC